MNFGQRVKKYRELRQMSQMKLAKLAGYTSASTISKIESGERDVPQNQIKALADALSVSPSALLFDLESEEASEEEVKKEMLWKAFRLLNEDNQRTIFVMINALAAQQGDSK